jgi:DNA-binding NarL/FixJ family response regulator
MSIQIAIADDHQMVVNGIKTMLADYPRIRVTGTWETGAALIRGLEEQLPDVLLLDIQLPDKTGDKLAPLILKKHPTIRILTLTNYDSAFYARNMLYHGALGYLLKSTDRDTLIMAIETVHAGQEFLEPSMKQQIEAKNLKTNRAQVRFPSLQAREREILQLIADGYTSQKIIQTLHLSANTVDNYRSTLLLKFGVTNTAALIKKAVQMGLVD